MKKTPEMPFRQTQKTVFFKADANRLIGSGHLVRCLLLADELSQVHIQIHFLFSETQSSYYTDIANAGYKYSLLQYNKTNPQIFIDTIQRHSELADALLIIDSDIDGYYSEDFQKTLISSNLKLMHITIKNQFRFWSHIVLNQNIIALSQKYVVENYTKLLLGPEFFIFNKQFRNRLPQRGGHKDGKNLLVVFGTSDYYHLTLRLLIELLKNHALFDKIKIVVGRMNNDLGKIQKLSDGFPPHKIELHVDSPEMSKIMLDTDIAITSCGLTFWEISSLKIPSLVIPGSKREKEVAKYLADLDYCYYLTDYDTIEQEKNMADKIEDCVRHRIRSIKIDKFCSLININGMDKVIDEIKAVLDFP